MGRHGLRKATVPDTLLIMGSDASGKNHVANVAAELIQSGGGQVEKREGWFSRKASDVVTSERKGALKLLGEWLFIATAPLTRHVMSEALSALVRWDLKNYRKSDRKIIVISHTPIRILAFYLGHQHENPGRIVLPKHLHEALSAIRPVTGAKAIILDIGHETRKTRIAKRSKKGLADRFDLYLARDGELSERIEDILVMLAERYFGAFKIVNEDAGEEPLRRQIAKAFEAFEERKRDSNQIVGPEKLPGEHAPREP